MSSLRTAITGATATAAAAVLVVGAAGVANAAATIPVTSGHIDLVEVVCDLDQSGAPTYEVATHVEGIGDIPSGTGDAPAGSAQFLAGSALSSTFGAGSAGLLPGLSSQADATNYLSDYVFDYTASTSEGHLTYTPGDGATGTWTSSGEHSAEEFIPAVGFHYEAESEACAETVTIDVANAPGASNTVSFVSNQAESGNAYNGTTSTVDPGVVTLGNPQAGSLYEEHIHGTWSFQGAATGQTYPLQLSVNVPGGPVTVGTAYLRVQP